LTHLRARTAIIAGLLLLAIACTAWGYPKPSAVPYRWQLDFEPGQLRLYTDPIDGEHYWFFTYVITNNTGRDQLWAPFLRALHRSGRHPHRRRERLHAD
jgi:hypothetical protein